MATQSTSLELAQTICKLRKERSEENLRNFQTFSSNNQIQRSASKKTQYNVMRVYVEKVPTK
jgi:hypothetical protein